MELSGRSGWEAVSAIAYRPVPPELKDGFGVFPQWFRGPPPHELVATGVGRRPATTRAAARGQSLDLGWSPRLGAVGSFNWPGWLAKQVANDCWVFVGRGHPRHSGRSRERSPTSNCLNPNQSSPSRLKNIANGVGVKTGIGCCSEVASAKAVIFSMYRALKIAPRLRSEISCTREGG